MPLYEYTCRNGHVIQQYRTVDERHAAGSCKYCGLELRKVILHPPRVFSDYAGYESPASGNWIVGKRARAEDLARTGCRPYEAGEREAMLRRQAENDRQLDKQVDEVVERTINDLSL